MHWLLYANLRISLNIVLMLVFNSWVIEREIGMLWNGNYSNFR